MSQTPPQIDVGAGDKSTPFSGRDRPSDGLPVSPIKAQILVVSSQTERVNTALAGRYRIERHLGAGGMATVYLAEDLKHDRKVALKLLKPELAAVLGAERFVVEIKTTASLQHPHILPLFDSGTADGFLYYVMPFIEGETLRDRLNRETQLAVDEAVRITRVVADALDYAHRRGVIHRDIKPENILLHDGRPMVADFGIALAVSAAAGGRMTETGLSLGTPHYMSPEQATADKEITGRSDIYSLASVLYEMLTGNPLHVGSSAQQIIMKIIAEPVQPVTALRKAVPPNVASAIARALEKLPADRFTTAKEFAEALSNTAFAFSATAHATVPADTKWKTRFLALAGATAIVAALMLAAWRMQTREPELPENRFDLSFGDITPSGNSDVIISPDGSMIAFAGFKNGEQAIYMRRLAGDPDFVKVPGTESADGSPSFSPDSRSIAFRRQSDARLLKISIDGSGSTALAQLSRTVFPYVHWGTANQLIYNGGATTGPVRISSSGGQSDTIGLPGFSRGTFLLPDGSGFLASRGLELMLHDFRTDSTAVLIPFGVAASYVETGHLVYVAENGGLFAVPFDLGSHRVTGPPARVVERIAVSPIHRGYSLSRNGTLVYHDGLSVLDVNVAARTLMIVLTPGGRADTLRLPAGRRANPRFSPDGRSIAFEFATSRTGMTDLYAFDLVTGTNTQLTFEGDNDDPVWSPDGKSIAFTKSVAQSGEDVFLKRVDNSAPETQLLSMPGNQNPMSWPDTGTILIQSTMSGGQFDLLMVSRRPGDKPRPYLEAPWTETEAEVSPDRKLAAMTTGEGAGSDIWIRDYPVPQGKWRVSANELSGSARWSPDGSHLYYWRGSSAAPDTLYRARVERRPSVVVHPSEVVTAIDLSSIENWDIHPDGKRIVVTVDDVSRSAASSASRETSRYVIVQNWFSELKRLTSRAKQ